jgi:hypothetical protein
MADPTLSAIVVDYTAYLDASGTDAGQKVVGFSGFLSTARQWAKFSKRWVQALKGPPALEYFHMTEFLYRKGKVGAGWWTDEQRLKLIEKLVEAIWNYPMLAFGCTVSISDYEAVFSVSERAPYGSPDVFCLPWCFKAVVDWLPKTLSAEERVGFIFDQDDCSRMLHAASTFHFVKSLPGMGRLGAIQFADKRLHCPLQAADLLAHQEFQAMKSGKVGRSSRRF